MFVQPRSVQHSYAALNMAKSVPQIDGDAVEELPLVVLEEQVSVSDSRRQQEAAKAHSKKAQVGWSADPGTLIVGTCTTCYNQQYCACPHPGHR